MTSTTSDIAEAIAAAESAGISLAVSNPCFEVWLILHFADCTAGVAGPKAAEDKLRKHMPGYAKGTLDFAVLAGKVDKAVERAKALGAGNPSSDMWRLVEVVRKH
nr:RloB family protein [Lentzea albidocapillata]